MKYITLASLVLTFSLSASANLKYSTYHGKAELYTPSVSQEILKIVGNDSQLQSLSSMIFISGKNNPFLEELVNSALKKNKYNTPNIHVMYRQTYPEVDYNSLSDEQKKFMTRVTGELSGAYIQIDIDGSEENIVCEKNIDVDIQKMNFNTTIGCYFPAPVETGVRALIETKFDQINIFTKEEIKAIKSGDFPESLKNDPDFIKLVDKYGEAVIGLGLGSMKYRYDIETTIADGKIILRPHGGHLSSTIEKMLPLSKDDNDFQQNFRYLENTTFFKNQKGNIICSQINTPEDRSVIFLDSLNNGTQSSKSSSCMYVIDISKYLNQLL